MIDIDGLIASLEKEIEETITSSKGIYVIKYRGRLVPAKNGKLSWRSKSAASGRLTDFVSTLIGYNLSVGRYSKERKELVDQIKKEMLKRGIFEIVELN